MKANILFFKAQFKSHFLHKDFPGSSLSILCEYRILPNPDIHHCTLIILLLGDLVFCSFVYPHLGLPGKKGGTHFNSR